MFKYKAIYGDRWLDAFINLVTCFRKNEIHCVFIYDNGSPPEKQKEKEERSLQKRKLEERVEKLDIEINNFHLSQEITDYLLGDGNDFERLQALCLLMIIIFFLKNLFLYFIYIK